jgi:hypothetical protein
MTCQHTDAFDPVSTMEDLLTLDSDEMVAGYRDYCPTDPWPGENRGRAYWHGWRNAAIDRGMINIDAAAQRLAREYLLHQKAH